jgi:hypothetical protein
MRDCWTRAHAHTSITRCLKCDWGRASISFEPIPPDRHVTFGEEILLSGRILQGAPVYNIRPSANAYCWRF